MNIPPAPHPWNLLPKEAVAVQKLLASMVIQSAPGSTFRWIAGLDAALRSNGQECLGAVVLWDLLEERIVEMHTASLPLTFPYVPGLLSFREAPALLTALGKLSQTPDLLMCDGQGLAHPRGFGIACHIGILCNLPSLGCAKSLLIGTYDEPSENRGSLSPLFHKGTHIGTVLRTRTGVRPVFVSIGHKINLSSAVDVVLRCCTRYRLPEPTRLADKLSKKSD